MTRRRRMPVSARLEAASIDDVAELVAAGMGPYKVAQVLGVPVGGFCAWFNAQIASRSAPQPRGQSGVDRQDGPRAAALGAVPADRAGEIELAKATMQSIRWRVIRGLPALDTTSTQVRRHAE